MRSEVVRRSLTPVVILVVLGCLLTLGTVAWAGPGWGGPRGACRLTPEQAAQAFDAREKFRNETVELRKQMAVKHAELAALWQAEKPDEKAILAKKKEINALRDQLQEKAVGLGLKMRQIAPQGWGGPMGMGGSGGLHLGMGPHGSGPGCPW